MVRFVASASLLLTVLWSPLVSRVAAEDSDPAVKAKAKALFEQAVSDFEAGHNEAALAGFQEAFRLAPHPMVRVNMANCYDKLDRPLEAIFHFEQFLNSPDVAPSQRKEVEAALERLRAQVGDLKLNVAPDGASIVVDGGEQRRSPVLTPVRLKKGSHEVVVSLDGYRTETRTVEVPGGKSAELSVTLERDTAPEPTPAVAAEMESKLAVEPAPEPAEIEPMQTEDEPMAEAPPPESAIPLSAWIVGGVTAAVLVTATITGILALDAESEFNSELKGRWDPSNGPREKDVHYLAALDAADRADNLALTSDILWGVGAVGAGITAYLIIAHDQDSEQARITPLLSPEFAGARTDIRF